MAQSPQPAPVWLTNMSAAFWSSLIAARTAAGAKNAPGAKVNLTWIDGATYDVTALYKLHGG